MLSEGDARRAYIIAVFGLVVGHGEVCQVPQDQHALQAVLGTQQERLAPTRGERQRLG